MNKTVIIKELHQQTRGKILQDLIKAKLLINIWIEKIALTELIYTETEKVLSSEIINEFSEMIGNLKVANLEENINETNP